jgi:hypothetical protein
MSISFEPSIATGVFETQRNAEAHAKGAEEISFAFLCEILCDLCG